MQAQSPNHTIQENNENKWEKRQNCTEDNRNEESFAPLTYINLEDVKVWVDTERVREAVDEGAVARARLTIRCLYPEPGAARVEY